MSALETLPPDQKAVLQLLLKQGKSYDDLSRLLRIEPHAVRERALDAMDALGPEDEAAGLDSEHQDQVADFLLGQADPGAAAATRTFLEGSPGGRAWAHVVAGELQPLAPTGLPEIPEAGDGGRDARPDPPAPRATTAPAVAPAHVRDEPEDPEDRDDLDGEDDDRDAAGDHAGATRAPRSSKLGGVILLLGIAALLALVLVVALTKNDDKKTKTSAASTPTTATAGSQSTPAGQPTVEQQINMRPETQGSKALGVANVVSQGGSRAIALIGQGIKPAGSRYAVWLTNGKTSQFLGFAPPVKANGRLQGLAGVPKNLADFRDIIVTREQVDRPKQPGTVVLRGPLRKG
jgi:hypothetical protein